MAIIGENHIVRISLFQSDGSTPQPLSQLSSITAKVKQMGRILATYVYGTDPEIRLGEDTNQVEVEIRKIVSNKFRHGVDEFGVLLELLIEKTDSDFEVDLVHKDIAIIEILDVS